MSESELSDPSVDNIVPPDAQLEKSLRDIVAAHFKNGNLQSVTPNLVRAESEKALVLDPGFYVNHPKWKAKSKTIIKNEADRQNAAGPSDPGSSIAPSAKPATQLAPTKASKPMKRLSVDIEERIRKKRKTSEPVVASKQDESSTLSELSDEEPEQNQTAKRRAGKAKLDGSAERTRKPSKDSAASGTAQKLIKPPPQQGNSEDEVGSPNDADLNSDDHKHAGLMAAAESESDLSEVLDEAPKPKKSRKRSEARTTKVKTVKPSKSKTDGDLDPDEAEIKRLQGWLVRCGIRKLWGKELKPYPSSKGKINHLREMLSHAGMTGRYSIEKATQIKEARELAADIEAVQEGAERWGKRKDQGEDDGGARSRRLVRGSKNYEFLSSDGEETD